MVYPEYVKYKMRYNESQEIFASILLEKERIFTKTQPNAIRYDKDQVQTSVDGNILEDYVVLMDEKRIDERLANVRQTLSGWEILLESKERELRKSNDKYDRLYVLKILDGFGINKICKIMNYSKAQVYRMLKNIYRKTK